MSRKNLIRDYVAREGDNKSTIRHKLHRTISWLETTQEGTMEHWLAFHCVRRLEKNLG